MDLKCSSPPHSSSTEDYGSLKPSAMESFKKIREQANGGKQIALFLDYDGTLSPIVDKPEHAIMSTKMRLAVQNVAKLFPTAIISGRSRAKVEEFVQLKELYYAGSHGMDIVGPTHKQGTSDSEEKLFQPDAASDLIRMIDQLIRLFVAGTDHIRGVEVENNKFCLSVHYRNVAEEDLEKVARIVENILKNYPLFHKTDGLKVFEIRPKIQWNKGNAVEFLLKTLGLEDGARVLPIYIGDDRTDEDAFKVFKRRGYGIGILVSSVPKPTDAVYSLKDPDNVMLFLETLARWKNV